MLLLRILLLPISYLYGIITYLRNVLFDIGIFKSKTPPIPTICLGNLSVGGTGKTPHVEYLINLLKSEFKLATLSRGYGRKTKGFLLADTTHNYHEIGDEPLQFFTKFKKFIVAVDENRNRGIKKLITQFPNLQLVLLDDCFQHRWVKAGLNILLIDYHTIDQSQYLLPTGNLREFSFGRKRADIIILTKSPSIFSPIEKRRAIDLLKPHEHQQLFFSYIDYLDLVPLTVRAKELLIQEEHTIKLVDFKTVLFAGVANVSPLIDCLKDEAKELAVLEFPDHHAYTIADILRVIKIYESMLLSKKIIVTTEKDAMRVKDPRLMAIIEEYPIFYKPIKVVIHQENNAFDTIVKTYVKGD